MELLPWWAGVLIGVLISLGGMLLIRLFCPLTARRRRPAPPIDLLPLAPLPALPKATAKADVELGLPAATPKSAVALGVPAAPSAAGALQQAQQQPAAAKALGGGQPRRALPPLPISPFAQVQSAPVYMTTTAATGSFGNSSAPR